MRRLICELNLESLNNHLMIDRKYNIDVCDTVYDIFNLSRTNHKFKLKIYARKPEASFCLKTGRRVMKGTLQIDSQHCRECRKHDCVKCIISTPYRENQSTRIDIRDRKTKKFWENLGEFREYLVEKRRTVYYVLEDII